MACIAGMLRRQLELVISAHAPMGGERGVDQGSQGVEAYEHPPAGGGRGIAG